MKTTDITGMTFGRLTVLRRSGSISGKASWLCRCACGKEKVIVGTSLRKTNGNTLSCGCFQREWASNNAYKHGNAIEGKQTATHRTWSGMLQRCNNPKHAFFHRYGGRGISVCERWLDFRNFLADMGDRPASMTIDRIDNNLGYFKDNCRWATQREQTRNTQNNKPITYNGKTQSIPAWEDELGLRRGLIKSRINHGWDTAKALNTPTREYKKCQ